VQLIAAIAPGSASNTEVSWISSDPAAATVSTTGLVTAVAVGTTTITVTTVDGGFSAQCVVTVTATPTWGISIDAPADHVFTQVQADYTYVTPLEVTVSNTGNQSTGNLTVTLSGSNSDAFVLTGYSITSFAPTDNAKFTVAPKLGLTPNTYTAIVTVSGGDNITDQVFNVSFTVVPVPSGINLVVRFNLNFEGLPARIDFSRSDTAPTTINLQDYTQLTTAEWIVNGRVRGTGPSFTLNGAHLNDGVNRLSIHVIHNGHEYSTVVYVRVRD
jgi:hypothetical protein